MRVRNHSLEETIQPKLYVELEMPIVGPHTLICVWWENVSTCCEQLQESKLKLLANCKIMRTRTVQSISSTSATHLKKVE